MYYFCPNCFAEIQEETQVCPQCQFHLDRWDELDYDQKLMAAIHHKETATRMRAVYLLGERKNQAAIEPLQAAFRLATDPYFKAEILAALWKIDQHEFDRFAQSIDLVQESTIVEKRYQQLITENRDDHVLYRSIKRNQ